MFGRSKFGQSQFGQPPDIPISPRKPICITGGSEFGRLRFGRGQFGQAGRLCVTSATTGGGSGKLVRYFADRKRESLEYLITHRSISASFDGTSTFTATLSARALIKSEFKRTNKVNGRIKGRARTRTAISSTRIVASMKVVGRIAIRTRGPVRMQTRLSGSAHSQMRCIGIENPPEEILQILER